MSARFELEQSILRLWGTDEDVKLIYNSIESLIDDEDRLMNALLGLIELIHLRGQKCFSDYEDLLKELREEKLNGK